MKYFARRLVHRVQNNLAHRDGWFALAVFVTILVPVIAIIFY